MCRLTMWPICCWNWPTTCRTARGTHCAKKPSGCFIPSPAALPSRPATATQPRRWSPWRRRSWMAACRRSARTAAPACLKLPGRSWKNSLAVLSDPRPVVVAVGGPTATGKTALAVALAKRFGGEVLSADSMQIYKGLDIGTAKATPEEQGGVPHHLLDIVEPETPFSVADFTARADGIIRALS